MSIETLIILVVCCLAMQVGLAISVLVVGSRMKKHRGELDQLALLLRKHVTAIEDNDTAIAQLFELLPMASRMATKRTVLPPTDPDVLEDFELPEKGELMVIPTESWTVEGLDEDDTHPNERRVIDETGRVVCDVLLDGLKAEDVERMNQVARMIATCPEAIRLLRDLAAWDEKEGWHNDPVWRRVEALLGLAGRP